MLDLSTEYGRRVQKRLQAEELIWFVSVNPRGVPAANPVWFYWDGEAILVYSQPSSYRVRNIRTNPQVSLHLQTVEETVGNIVILNGQAALTPDNHIVPEGYWQKYDRFLPDLGLDRRSMIASYSVQIRVTNLKARGE